MAMDAPSIRTWKDAALRPELAGPVPTHQLDQILAAAREAGLSEREQGVLLMTMTLGDLDKKLREQGRTATMTKKIAVAASMVMRMLARS